MKGLTKILCLTAAVSALIGCSEKPAPETAQPSLEQKIRQTAEQSLQAFNIPGLAVVAVKDGEVVLAEGFGIRDIE
mgnify:FL=1